jgi:AcrR family transcriptional regulator
VSTARRTQAERIAETTGKLRAAARKAFAAQGFAETSMDALCAEAGLTRGALYHHFGGKEGLFEAILREIDGEIAARLDAVYDTHADGLDGVRACCLTYLRMALEPEIARVMLKDAPAVLGERFRQIDAQSSLEPTIEALCALMQAGRLRRVDPEALARMLNGALIDAALWIAASADPETTLAKAEAAFAAMLDGLAL